MILAKLKINIIESDIGTYCHDTGKYPKTFDDLFICTPGLEDVWKGPYLKRKYILDPWNNPFIYEPNGTVNPGGYDIISYGADGKPGGQDNDEDIYND